jgi:hypothetical protein
VQAASGRELFLFVVNMQVPGVTHYSMVFYFAQDRPLVPGSLLHRFVHGDDSFRNSRLKLIPSIPKVGLWSMTVAFEGCSMCLDCKSWSMYKGKTLGSSGDRV